VARGGEGAKGGKSHRRASICPKGNEGEREMRNSGLKKRTGLEQSCRCASAGGGHRRAGEKESGQRQGVGKRQVRPKRLTESCGGSIRAMHNRILMSRPIAQNRVIIGWGGTWGKDLWGTICRFWANTEKHRGRRGKVEGSPGRARKKS